MMCNKIKALKVKYWYRAEILDNDTIEMHLLLVCTKLYKSELTQVQVEAKVNNTEIKYKSLIRNVNVAWRIKSSREGVTQVGENKVVLMNTEFKGKYHTCRKYGHRQTSVLIRKNQTKIEKTRSLQVSAITMSRWGIKLQTAGNMRPIKKRDPRTELKEERN